MRVQLRGGEGKGELSQNAKFKLVGSRLLPFPHHFCASRNCARGTIPLSRSPIHGYGAQEGDSFYNISFRHRHRHHVLLGALAAAIATGEATTPGTMDSSSLLHRRDRPSQSTSMRAPPVAILPESASAPASPPQHCQAKRARMTPISDQIRAGIQNSDQGGGSVEVPHCSNPRETSSAEGSSRMSTGVSTKTPNKSNNGNGHVLESKIIKSRYTEEQLAAEPLLGVADWFKCTPAALRVTGDLTSPAPKYRSQKFRETRTSTGPGGGSEVLENRKDARSGSENPPRIPEHKVQERVTSSDPTLYVWDLDETLIIFQTLRNGRYAEHFKGCKDAGEACELGKRWESLILDVCDDYFFYKQVEDYNEPSLLSLQDFDDEADLSHYEFCNDNFTVPVDVANKKKLAYRHRVVGDIYAKGLEKLLTRDQLTEWKNLYEATDRFTDGWLTAGRELLEECQRENQKKIKNQQKFTGNSAEALHTVDCDPILQANISASNYNILVTSGTLIPSLVKCLLFRIDKYFHHFNIYSSRDVGKLQCFHWIKERVQSLPLRFCVIGDGVDECEASRDLSWPFLKIDIGPYGLYRLPTVTMDILEYEMNIIYDPSKIPEQ